MKKSLIYLLFASLIFSFSACECDDDNDHQTTVKQEINMDKEKAKVSELLDQLATATEGGDIEMVEKIWCSKERSLLLGTESNEKLMGWEQIKTAMSGQSSAFSEMLISITDQNIWLSQDAKTAWFFEELNYNFIFKDKAMSFEGIRFTGVFVKSPEVGWKLVQGHMSVASHIDPE